jgi:hypothetical protein
MRVPPQLQCQYQWLQYRYGFENHKNSKLVGFLYKIYFLKFEEKQKNQVIFWFID